MSRSQDEPGELDGGGPGGGGVSARPAPKPVLEPHTLLHLARSSRDVFELCVSLALSATRATTVLTLLHRPELEVMEVVAAAGHLAEQARGRRLRRGAALSWQVFDAGEALLIREAHKAPGAHFLSGRPRPGMYLGVPLIDPDGVRLGVLSVDTTDSDETLSDEDTRTLTLLGQAAGVAYSRLRALEQAQQTAHRFEQLAQLSSDLEVLHTPDEIARSALEVLLEISGFDMGGVFSVQQGSGKQQGGPEGQGVQVTLRVLTGPGIPPFLDVAALRVPQAAMGILAEVIASGAVLVVPDYSAWMKQTPQEVGMIASALAAPLRSQGRVVGVIGLAHYHTPREVSPELRTMLEMVASRIDRAVERAANVEGLRLLREAALRAVGRVLEYRDDETFGHTDRVTALAMQLGRRLGLDELALQHLCWGAYMHDVGKVAVSDAVLRKPGPLTPQERAEMQRHVVIGDEMLRDEQFVPRQMREVVRSHHERWDGGGYPDGLAGEQIPLLARIFSVVDVYDALTNRRPYKLAWSPQAAQAELHRCAGTQFDAQMVRAFLQLLADEEAGAEAAGAE